jgi:hypothetical protein
VTKERKNQIYKAAKEDQKRIKEVVAKLTLFQSRREKYREKEDLMILATATAAELAHLYTGIESLTEKALRLGGIALPEKSGAYHVELFETAKQNGLIRETAHINFLSDLRMFRHFERNAYGILLRNEEIQEKAETALVLTIPVTKAIRKFINRQMR